MTDDDKRLERVKLDARNYRAAGFRFVPVARDELDWVLSQLDSAHAEIERLKGDPLREAEHLAEVWDFRERASRRVSHCPKSSSAEKSY